MNRALIFWHSASCNTQWVAEKLAEALAGCGIPKMSCLFCSIANHQIPSTIVYEDDKVIVFRDIHPQAPVHILIVPKKHVVSIADVMDSDLSLVAYMLKIAKIVGEKEGLREKGYRLVINTGPEAGQVVLHLHMHLLGGRKMPDKMIKSLE